MEQEEGERRRLTLDRSRQDVADTYDNVINVAAGEINERENMHIFLTSQNTRQNKYEK